MDTMSVRTLIQNHTLLDVIDDTTRGLSSLTVVKPEKIRVWSRNSYTFIHDPRLLDTLENGLQQCAWLDTQISAIEAKEFRPPRYQTQIRREDDIDQDLTANLNRHAETIINDYGELEHHGYFNVRPPTGSSGTLDFIFRYVNVLLGFVHIGFGIESKVRGAFGPARPLVRDALLSGPIRVCTVRNGTKVQAVIPAEDLHLAIEDERSRTKMHRRITIRYSHILNEFENNPDVSVIVQHDCHTYTVYQRGDQGEIRVSDSITNLGLEYPTGAPVRLVDKPLGLWLSLIVRRAPETLNDEPGLLAGMTMPIAQIDTREDPYDHTTQTFSQQRTLRSNAHSQTVDSNARPAPRDPLSPPGDSSSDSSDESLLITTADVTAIGKSSCILVLAPHRQYPQKLEAGLHSDLNELQSGPLFGPIIPTGGILPILYHENRSTWTSSSPDQSRLLTFHSLMRSGHLWDVYSTGTSFIFDNHVVAKVFCPSTSRAESSEWEISEDDARTSIANENELYVKHLTILQGDVVPRWYGLYGGLIPRRTIRAEVETWVALMEDVGEEMETKDVDRSKVINAYTKLHNAGIVHGDVEYRHIRRRDGGICLIDFDKGKYVEDSPDAEDLKEEEMREVRRVFGI